MSSDQSSIAVTDQYYYGGYSLEWFPVDVSQGEGDPALSADDVWSLRLIYGDNDIVVSTVRTLSDDGSMLVLTFTFTAEQTLEFSRFGNITVILEDLPNGEPRPRLTHKLVLSKDIPARELT